MDTQIAIVGAGPGGLTLGTLLAEPGIESVGDRLAREGLEHHGIYLR